ncbi:MAG: NADH-quinone oxidoreductase subunit A [Deltaproteobacteria bacterium]|nr:NADH-quinone oxidoreductase subunit A [Deltaproteobacteria bacterium]
MNGMLTDFATVLVFMVLGAVTVALMLLVSRLVQPRDPTAVKLSTYECGEVPFGSSWVQFNIRFYVVALIFIIFDVEVALLYPWAVIFQRLGMVAFVEAFVFIVILLAGLAYLWKEGDLDWVRTMQDAPAPKEGK